MDNYELEDLGVNGFIRFSIKADDTEPNRKTHESFKEFCKTECDDNYTLGLRKLLEYYQLDWKYESLWDEIGILKGELEVLKNKIKEEKKEKDNEVF